MAMTEKQAIIIGAGGFAVLFLLHAKKVQAAPAKTNKLGTKATTASSALRPSANLATKNATATRAQAPSTIGIGAGRVAVNVPTSLVDKLFALLRPTAAKTTVPQTPQQQKPSTSAGGGSGGGSSQAQKGGYQAPGGNPWSSAGDFTGRSSVTSNVPDNAGNLQGYDTGLSSTSDAGGDVGVVPGQSPQNTDLLASAHESVDANGDGSDDLAAIQYDDAGPVLPVGYDPETGTFDDQGPQLPVPQDAVFYDDATGSMVAADASPADVAPLDSYQTVPADSFVDDSFIDGDMGGGGGGDDAYFDA